MKIRVARAAQHAQISPERTRPPGLLGVPAAAGEKQVI
jgi:hypothetical protein